MKNSANGVKLEILKMTLNEFHKNKCRDGHSWLSTEENGKKIAICAREGCTARFNI